MYAFSGSLRWTIEKPSYFGRSRPICWHQQRALYGSDVARSCHAIALSGVVVSAPAFLFPPALCLSTATLPPNHGTLTVRILHKCAGSLLPAVCLVSVPNVERLLPEAGDRLPHGRVQGHLHDVMWIGPFIVSIFALTNSTNLAASLSGTSPFFHTSRYQSSTCASRFSSWRRVSPFALCRFRARRCLCLPSGPTYVLVMGKVFVQLATRCLILKRLEFIFCLSLVSHSGTPAHRAGCIPNFSLSDSARSAMLVSWCSAQGPTDAHCSCIWFRLPTGWFRHSPPSLGLPIPPFLAWLLARSFRHPPSLWPRPFTSIDTSSTSGAAGSSFTVSPVAGTFIGMELIAQWLLNGVVGAWTGAGLNISPSLLEDAVLPVARSVSVGLAVCFAFFDLGISSVAIMTDLFTWNQASSARLSACLFISARAPQFRPNTVPFS